MNFCPALLTGAGLAQFASGETAAEIHLPRMTVAPDFDVELLAECIDAAYAHTVQTARHLIRRGVELTACVEFGQNDLHRRHHLPVGQGHQIDGDAAAIVGDSNRIVDVNDYFDFLGIAGERLVHGVVDDLVHEVMEAHFACRTDVHGGTEANCLKPLKNFDIFAGVAAVRVLRFGEGDAFSRHRGPFRLSCANRTQMPRLSAPGLWLSWV